MAKYLGIVFLVIIMTSCLAIAAVKDVTLLTSAAKVIQLKKQMVQYVRPFITKTPRLPNDIKRFTSVLKSLKSELEIFIGTEHPGNNSQQLRRDQLAFRKVILYSATRGIF